jgi:hypothetical protein
MSADKSLDLASIRARLDGARGRRFWQSFEELADTEEFRRLCSASSRSTPGWFDGRPPQLPEADGRVARSPATAYAAARRAIVPPVRQPENSARPPAVLRDSHAAGRSAIGVLAGATRTADQIERRSTASLGATDAFAQASVLQPDPDRATTIVSREIRPWGSLVQAIQNAIGTQRRCKAPGSAS